MAHKKVNSTSIGRDSKTGKFVIKEGRIVRGGVASTGTLPSRPEPPAPSKDPSPNPANTPKK